jgi:adenosine deaminase
MFHTTLLEEFASAMQTGLSLNEVLAINRTAFEHAFLPDATRQSFLAQLP